MTQQPEEASESNLVDSKRNSRARRILILSLIILLLVLVSVFLTNLTGGLLSFFPVNLKPSSLAVPSSGQPENPLINIGDDNPQAGTNDNFVISEAPATLPFTGIASTFVGQGTPLAQVTSVDTSLFGQGALVLALEDGIYSHLFAYQPQTLPFTRLTSGERDDITPSISPDGTRLAFSSNRGGHWDLYILDLRSGGTIKITDTPEYDASPSWSPDGRWLAYESYVEGNGDGEGDLEIFIRDISVENPESQAPIRLTQQPGADFSPAWAPSGRQIAFVSHKSGNADIFLANLDQIDGRFSNISNQPDAPDTRPLWSPDGRYLAWASVVDGVQTVMVWDNTQSAYPPQPVGNGSWPVWSPTSNAIFTTLETPNHIYLTGYTLPENGLALSPVALKGAPLGMTWLPESISQSLPSSIVSAAQFSPTPDWQMALSPVEGLPGARYRVMPLNDVSAPYPYLHDQVDEAYQALRAGVIRKAGWDFLAILENAYVPLTTPLLPGMLDDWLYTGRAIAASTAPVNAGWLLMVREDFGPATYWRIYLRARFQDGTQGMPLRDLPWNLYARSSGDPKYYEQGGGYTKTTPSGYWVDFTRLAAHYGWGRVPALSSWRIAYSAARFNEYVLTSGLSWHSAMLEVYPPEAVATVTPIPPPTSTPTITPIPTRTPTPTQTIYISPTPTPTRTPRPTDSTRPTSTRAQKPER